MRYEQKAELQDSNKARIYEARMYEEKKKQMSSKNKKYLVKFNCIIGDYEHITSYVFDKQMSEYQYCKKFWGLSKKNELKTNVFWDDFMQNAIEVYSETEIKTNEYNKLQELGVI